MGRHLSLDSSYAYSTDSANAQFSIKSRIACLCVYRSAIMLREIILQPLRRILQLPRQLVIRLGLLDQSQELIILERIHRIELEHPLDITRRHRIDYGLVLLDPDIRIRLQYLEPRHAGVDTSEAVKKSLDIDDPARQAHAAKGIAEMRGVGGQQHTPDGHFLHAALVHAVGTDVDDLVLIWFRVTRQHLLELQRLALQELLVGQAR